MNNDNGILSIHDISLDKLFQSSISEVFREKLVEIKNNINDPRTWIEHPRKIVIEITIKPKDTEEAIVYTKIKANLAPIGSKPQVLDLTAQQLLKRVK